MARPTKEHYFPRKAKFKTQISPLAPMQKYGLPKPYNWEFHWIRLMSMENLNQQQKAAVQVSKLLILMVILGTYIATQ